MFGIKFFDRPKPKGFNYIPRHYDPEQERREQRRRELLGPDAPSVRRHDEKNGEYVPGRIVRQAQADRRGYGTHQKREKRNNSMGTIGLLLILLVLLYLFLRPTV